MNEWTEIVDNGGIIDSVDFMKAFDKVPHKRLIKKMERYGINNKTSFSISLHMILVKLTGL
jgi:hypothetical protein